MIARLQNLTYSYPGTETPALSGIDLAIEAGEVVGVIGASQSGKSSLCYVLSGMIPHFYKGELLGDAALLGSDLRTNSLPGLAGRVGLVLQNAFNQISGARFTVREELAFGLENLGLARSEIQERVAGGLTQFELDELAERSPFTLSGGQQQRVAIAAIWVMQPELLVLDEPTSQLDPASTRKIFELLRGLVKAGNSTVVIATHKLEWLAESADRVVALAGGRIVAAGPPGAVLSNGELSAQGVGLTGYTQAGLLAQADGFKKNKTAPVTLAQARAFFERQ
jgi:energy-coupling factor transporter ATP-binding protein EcfA2